jgi:hypothetical protein
LNVAGGRNENEVQADHFGGGDRSVIGLVLCAGFRNTMRSLGLVAAPRPSGGLRLRGRPRRVCDGGQAVDAINFGPIAVNPITQDFQVTLTEPGSGVPAAVSDFVNVDPLFFVDPNGQTLLTGLDVTLVSDNVVPLPVSFGNAVIQETGGWQNLDPLIKNFYGWDFTIPAVNVMSDVPEPSTWAMMALGFASLGFVGYRRSRKTAAFAA